MEEKVINTSIDFESIARNQTLKTTGVLSVGAVGMLLPLSLASSGTVISSGIPSLIYNMNQFAIPAIVSITTANIISKTLNRRGLKSFDIHLSPEQLKAIKKLDGKSMVIPIIVAGSMIAYGILAKNSANLEAINQAYALKVFIITNSTAAIRSIATYNLYNLKDIFKSMVDRVLSRIMFSTNSIDNLVIDLTGCGVEDKNNITKVLNKDLNNFFSNNKGTGAFIINHNKLLNQLRYERNTQIKNIRVKNSDKYKLLLEMRKDIVSIYNNHYRTGEKAKYINDIAHVDFNPEMTRCCNSVKKSIEQLQQIKDDLESSLKIRFDKTESKKLQKVNEILEEIERNNISTIITEYNNTKCLFKDYWTERSYYIKNEIDNTYAGYQGEKEVANYLGPYKNQYKIIQGKTFSFNGKKSQCDFVIITNKAVFIGEVKNTGFNWSERRGKGTHRVIIDKDYGYKIVNPNGAETTVKNPIAQNEKQVTTVKNIISTYLERDITGDNSIDVRGVVILPNGNITIQGGRDRVVNLAKLNTVLKSGSSHLEKYEIEAIESALLNSEVVESSFGIVDFKEEMCTNLRNMKEILNNFTNLESLIIAEDKINTVVNKLKRNR